MPKILKVGFGLKIQNINFGLFEAAGWRRECPRPAPSVKIIEEFRLILIYTGV
jgi:hypothetical protein